MKSVLYGLAATIMLFATNATAQTKTIQGEQRTLQGTVEAVDRGRRELTLKTDKDVYQVIEVPASVTRFDGIKVGDKLKAKYYENVVLSVVPPGQKSKDSENVGLSKAAGDKPAGTLSNQRMITATITAIDMKAPSIAFKGPNGWAYESKVKDKKMLGKVKVGDQVEITWTKALLVSFE